MEGRKRETHVRKGGRWSGQRPVPKVEGQVGGDNTEPTVSIQVSMEAGSDRATGSSLTGSQGQGDFNNWAGKKDL